MSEHAPKAPSGFYQLILCPGSFNAQKGLPDTNNSESIRGTAAHSMFDSGLKGNAPLREAKTLVVANDPSVGGVTHLTQEDTDAVRVAYDYVYSRVAAIWMASELRVYPGDFLLRDDVWGTLDVVAWYEFFQMIEVIDYKHGLVLVEVANNSQLIIYTLGIIAKLLKENPSFKPEHYTYKTTIIQPRGDHPLGAIRSAEYTYSEILSFADQYRLAAERADDLNAPRIPGPVQCRYCKVRTICSEAKQYILNSVHGVDGYEYLNGSDSLLEQALLRHPSSLTNEELRLVLDNAGLIRSFLKATEEYAKVAYLKGNRNFGYKLVDGRGTSDWAYSEDEILKALLTKQLKGGKPVTLEHVTKPRALRTPKQVISGLKSLVEDSTLIEIESLISHGRQKAQLVPVTNAAPGIPLEPEDFFEPQPPAVRIETFNILD